MGMVEEAGAVSNTDGMNLSVLCLTGTSYRTLPGLLKPAKLTKH
jgi:hypothetical protein